MDTKNGLIKHYQGTNEAELVERITQLIGKLGHPLKTSQLGQLDQFHARGSAGTVELAQLVDVPRGSVVLDAGSGLGGPARYLAETYDCQVLGIDLTPAYVTIARYLTEQTGLAQLAKFEVGDLLDLRFPDNHFDIVWTQHVVMNIRDRERLYRGFNRVLKPDGKLGFFDVLATDQKPDPVFPLPWSETPDTSFLLNAQETQQILTDCGFVQQAWRDVTDEALSSFQQPKSPTPPPVSLGSLIGPRAGTLIANLPRNIADGRIRFVMGVFTKTDSTR